MKVRSEILGGLVTGVYLVGVATLVYWKRTNILDLELNEIGDFLAGVFGPVAFLWLVLGYLQQGRELKLSSEALQLQAQELKNSVEQQIQLVAVGREQMAAQIEASTVDRKRYEKSMNANILFIQQERISSADIHTQTYIMTNIGADAIDVQLMAKLPGRNVHAASAVLKRDQMEKVPFAYEDVDEDFHTILHCFYRTHDGRLVGFKMDMVVSAETQMLAITPQVKLTDL